MCLATKIERSRTLRTCVHSQIGTDRQLRPTRAAENGRLIPLPAWPLLCGVFGTFGMAEMAWRVPSTAIEANGYDVELSRVVLAPGVVVDRSAEDL